MATEIMAVQHSCEGLFKIYLTRWHCDCWHGGDDFIGNSYI